MTVPEKLSCHQMKKPLSVLFLLYPITNTINIRAINLSGMLYNSYLIYCL